MTTCPAHRAHWRLSMMVATTAAAALTASHASAQVKSWNAAGGNWGTAGSWLPVGLPGPSNQVFIGNTAAAVNAFLTLNLNAAINTLSITDGMVLTTSGGQLIVTGATTVSGENSKGQMIWPSRLRIADGPANFDAIVSSITVSDEAWIEMDGGTLVATGVVTIEETTLFGGSGTVLLGSDQPRAMIVNGVLGVGTDGLLIVQEGDGLIDLDGDVAGDGILNITGSGAEPGAFDTLEIQGTALFDPMSDDIWLSAGNQLTMELDEGWELSSNAIIRFFAGFNTDLPARVNGSHIDIFGDLVFSPDDSNVRFDAPVTLHSSVVADVGEDASLEFNESVVLNGATILLGEGTEVDFDGPISILGGVLSTFSNQPSDGTFDFVGATTYNGTLLIDGNARQVGDASVVGPTTITAGVFDFDGPAGSVHWSIGNALTVNADAIDTGLNIFDGSMQISGTFLGRLTVNLADPDDQWTLAGTLELGGVAAILTTRIEGSRIRVNGAMEVTNAVQITADTTLAPAGSATFGTPTSRLRLTGESLVQAGHVFSGQGRLENAPSGEMVITTGTTLGSTDLVNAGMLRLDDSAGQVFVDAVTFEPTSTWTVDIGGSFPGTQHDRLQVNGAPSQLGGELDVRLIDLGFGVHAPPVGAVYTILSAPLGSLSGTFMNDPISFVPGNVYLWSVGYPSTLVADLVTLTVAAIIPCPADLNGNGIVDGADLGILLGSWGPCAGCLADFGMDGIVDGADLGILLGSWGACRTE